MVRTVLLELLMILDPHGSVPLCLRLYVRHTSTSILTVNTFKQIPGNFSLIGKERMAVSMVTNIGNIVKPYLIVTTGITTSCCKGITRNPKQT